MSAYHAVAQAEDRLILALTLSCGVTAATLTDRGQIESLPVDTGARPGTAALSRVTTRQAGLNRAGKITGSIADRATENGEQEIPSGARGAKPSVSHLAEPAPRGQGRVFESFSTIVRQVVYAAGSQAYPSPSMKENSIKASRSQDQISCQAALITGAASLGSDTIGVARMDARNASENFRKAELPKPARICVSAKMRVGLVQENLRGAEQIQAISHGGPGIWTLHPASFAKSLRFNKSTFPKDFLHGPSENPPRAETLETPASSICICVCSTEGKTLASAGLLRQGHPVRNNHGRTP